jgi:SPP1 gp7 family putative phage head morphogenesis protein
LSYYTDGNTPDLIFSTPEGWNPDQIAVFQTYWDSLVGDGQNKHLAKFVPHGVAPFDTKAAAMKDEFDEWLARVVCFAFSVSPQPFVKQMNRATAESSHQQALEEGIAPLQRWVKSVLDQCLQGPMGYPELEWAWDEEESVDPLVAAQIDQILVGNKPVITVDEARAGRGLPPLTAAQREELTPAPPPMLPAPGEDKPPTPAAEDAAKIEKKKITADDRFDATSAKLEGLLTTFLAGQADIVAAEIGKALGLAKAADYDPRAEYVADGLEFDWSPLVETVEPDLVTLAVDSGGDAMDDLGLFDEEVRAAMTVNATSTARSQAAELVGMKYVDGKLVPNPNAKWAITDATRDMIRQTATDAVREGWSNQKLAKILRADNAFSRARAITIARTETSRAQNDGAIAGWKATNIVAAKQWVVAPDCCDICLLLNGKVVPLDQHFPGGGPPKHPNCRCGLKAVLADE